MKITISVLIPIKTKGILLLVRNKKRVIGVALIGGILNLLVSYKKIIALVENQAVLAHWGGSDASVANPGEGINLTFQYTVKVNDKIIKGIDTISKWKIILVNIITVLVILLSYKEVPDATINNKRRYKILILGVNKASILVFVSLDLLLFYITFEKALIPLFYLVAFYGSRNMKLKAQKLLVLYTIFGSLFLLVGIIIIYLSTGTTNYLLLRNIVLDSSIESLVFILFYISFLVKTPTFPVHIWLPVAHSEGSTGTSVILAAIILKFGTYGIIRFLIPLFPSAVELFQPLVFTLCVCSILYSSITALSINDIKVIVAYSSIIHMNISNMGLFSNDLLGITGAYSYSLAHGFISGGLFILVGVLYNRYHTKNIKYYRGLYTLMPLFITLSLFFNLSNLSFPLSLGYLTETMILLSIFQINPFIAFASALACVLLPIVMFTLFQRISFGRLSSHLTTLYNDLSLKELYILLPLLIFNTFLGLSPHYLFDSLTLPLLNLIS